jgi:geranylgeranylglycerol-phosphate geranylgeranyltransferase
MFCYIKILMIVEFIPIAEMSIGRKIKGVFELFRVELPFAAGLCVIAGELIAASSSFSFHELLLGFLVGFFFSSSALILNDYLHFILCIT